MSKGNSGSPEPPIGLELRQPSQRAAVSGDEIGVVRQRAQDLHARPLERVEPLRPHRAAELHQPARAARRSLPKRRHARPRRVEAAVAQDEDVIAVAQDDAAASEQVAQRVVALAHVVAAALGVQGPWDSAA